MSVQENLKKLGLSLPNIPTPVANYVPWKRDGNTIYLSGQGPRDKDGKHITGTVGKDVTVEQAYEYAKLVGLNLLAAANAAAGGSLDKVEVLKVLGMVNAVPGFGDQPKVIRRRRPRTTRRARCSSSRCTSASSCSTSRSRSSPCSSR